MSTMDDVEPIRSVSFVSLGCPKNLVDSERMLGLLAADGLVVTPDPNEADAIVINTCGFLEASREESLGEIHAAIGLKERGRCKRVVVAGCLVQRHKTKLLADAPGIDRLVGVFDREHIVQAVRGDRNPRQAHGHYLGAYHELSETPLTFDRTPTPARRVVTLPQSRPRPRRPFEDDSARLRLTPRHYAYLRMSEGCNQGCAFCTIPSIRGPLRSKPVGQILLEARELAADGAVELNLIGQDTTSYGTDLSDSPDLAGLLRRLDRELRDVEWLRLMYAYPSCFTDAMIDAIGSCDRVVKYIDMPLQHINDGVLERMRRRVTRRQIETLLDKLRTRVPGIAIRTTFIAGSPGETRAEHDELVTFVRDFGFDLMGVFPYSPEPGTAMGRRADQVPQTVRTERVEELMLTQQQVAFARHAGRVGTTERVLIDRIERDEFGKRVCVARTAGQAPEIDSVVYVRPGRTTVHVGEFLNVTLTDWQGYDLVADPVRKSSRPLAVLA